MNKSGKNETQTYLALIYKKTETSLTIRLFLNNCEILISTLDLLLFSTLKHSSIIIALLIIME